MSYSKGTSTARTLLVVDDSPTMRKMVMACLGPSYNYVQAASGLEAIEKLALGTVDLIVLDINMPDMHGLQFLRFLRDNMSLSHIPVVILTTRTDQQTQIEARALGAADYFTKPFSPDLFASRIAQILAK
ncbi:MAG: response regulator [Thermoleophilia bacterium]|nr:response regulator [Thermoleophilia bacterium]